LDENWFVLGCLVKCPSDNTVIMFLPGRNIQQELQEKQRMYRRVEDLATSMLPPQIVQDCTISVQEVQCGDPTCAPIDTVITLLFGRYERTMMLVDGGTVFSSCLASRRVRTPRHAALLEFLTTYVASCRRCSRGGSSLAAEGRGWWGCPWRPKK
jgi:hypothetical protein